MVNLHGISFKLATILPMLTHARKQIPSSFIAANYELNASHVELIMDWAGLRI